MSSRILLVEDDPGLLLTITDLLTAESYDVESASDGETALAKALDSSFDLTILDVMLPKKNGFDVCRELRQAGVESSILMLSAKAEIVNRVVGLKLGADDYLTKPFDPAELLARIEALLRRARPDSHPPLSTFRFSDVELNFERAEVSKLGLPVKISTKELRLLQYLIQHRDRVVPRQEILQAVWDYNPDVSSRTIDTHIAWLRRKLDHPEYPKHIQTIRGKGYRFTI